MRAGYLSCWIWRAAVEPNAFRRIGFKRQVERTQAKVGSRSNADVPGLVGGGSPGGQR